MSDTAPAPAIEVVAGDPTAEELAAVVVVLQSRAPAPPPPPARPSAWAAPARRHRRPLVPGPGAWQASAWR
ncbi:acyl-CoA carboxylase subunit epsilon [Auraticoccus sp. F435]|uniref:Acyl-CoA carboxylase subunit epsilon n=1 Tax=Auraticoccus cholistanensis TaxID=2656650 RepID=A0A6A9UUV9_9ACTN|nr:acyl-CoA carboxylase subunit epsilon [Auraticoccus cholistanensis]MVA76458.1 acyl-CoA carboxylase subunit epsilon [Auraticoccus cholistanensis]